MLIAGDCDKEAILSGEVDVYVNDANVNIVAIGNVPQGNIAVGSVKVHVKDSLTLR